VAYSADGSRIATISRVDQTVRLWSCPDGHELWNRPIERRGSASHPALSPDGARVALIFNGRLNVWNTTQGELAWVEGAIPHPKYSAVFSPNGLNVLVARGNGQVHIRNAADGTLHADSTPPFVNSSCVAYSPDGLRIASGSADGALSVWDIETGAILLEVREHLDGIEQVTFSPDGRYIASTCADGTMRLWSAADGKCLRIHWAGESVRRKSQAVWVPPGVEDESPEGRVISASGDVWRQLAWQAWDYPGAPGEWTRLPLGAYPGEPPGI
jgi:WD40 repeat protein